MGRLNGIFAQVGGNLNNNFQKSQMPGGLPGGGGVDASISPIHNTRVLGMGMPRTQGCPYHWDTAALPFPQFPPVLFSCSPFLNPRGHDYLGAWNRLG